MTLKPSEWHLQVLKIKGKFFVDKVGVFGNVRAGDNWDRFMRVDLDIARTALGVKYLFSYVDNYICCIPPAPNGHPDFKEAKKKFSQYIKHYESLGVPLHKFHPPTLILEKHLGWRIDTGAGLVSIPEDRRLYLLGKLREYKEQDSCTLKNFESLVGMLSFCAQVISCLRPPLCHFFAKQAAVRKFVHSKHQKIETCLPWIG